MTRITLATLPTATAQQVFDQAALHLLTQNAKSVVPGSEGRCAYRGANGVQCAAGCFMTDEEYACDIEGLEKAGEPSSWTRLREQGLVPSEHNDLLRALQRLHDERKPAQWPDELTALACRYRLNPAVLTPPEPA